MRLHFVADESVDSEIVERLRDRRFEVLYVAEMSPGLSDDDVLRHANHGKAVLLTEDKDFGELVFRQQRISSGVVLIRLAGLSSESKAMTVTSAVEVHREKLYDSFSVIAPGSLRIRAQILPHPGK